MISIIEYKFYFAFIYPSHSWSPVNRFTLPNTAQLSGYGLRSRLLFNGDQFKYELWKVKFLGHLRIQKLLHVIENGDDDGDDSEGSSAEDNELVFAELVQVLNDTNSSLIIHDAKNDGKAAIELLRSHYLGTSAPRLIAL